MYDLILDAATSPQQEPDHDARNAQKGEAVAVHHPSHLLTFTKEATKMVRLRLQIKVCWWKSASTRSGTRARSSLWRPINRAFAGKWSLITYLDPHPKTDGTIPVRSVHLRVEPTRETTLCTCACKGCLRVAMRCGWCGPHPRAPRPLTHSRRPRRDRHLWSQTLLSQEPVERWQTAWSTC